MRAYLLALLMMTVSLAGCINDESTTASGIGDTTEDELALPDWQIGDEWLYTFITPEFGEDSARLVVADVREDDGLFMLGILQSFASMNEVKSILPGIDQIIIYLVAIIILLTRPRGLMGRKGVMEE